MSSGRPGSADEAAKLFQLVMDSLPQFIFWKDRNSVYLGCSKNFARVAGVESPEAIVGKTDFDLAWKREEAEHFRKIDREVMESAVARYNIVEPQLQADGREAWLETTKVPLFDDAGNVVGILGTWADITEKRAAKEALFRARKMESVGRLAGGIAHDFNNLLTGILGFADVLQRQLDDKPELARLALGVASAAERAADLTSKLLAFSRRGIMQRRAVDVHAAIESVVSLLTRSVGPDVKIWMIFDAKRHVVMGDVTEIESALLNLGLNARDAMPNGGKLTFETTNVTIDARERTAGEFEIAPGEYVRVTVRDNGIGMTPETRERAFEPFFTTKEAGAGTGLGLPAVYGAMVAHHGAIRVESESGRGSAILLDLPVTDAPAEPRRRSPTRLRRSGRVLVIDDQQTVLQAVQPMLEEMGLEVALAADGAAGLALLGATPHSFDLAIVDMIMPQMSGRECFHSLRALRPDLPILLVSGFLQNELLEDLIRHEGVSFLKKPFGRAALGQAVALALGQREKPSAAPP